MSEWLARARQHRLDDVNVASGKRAKIAKTAKMALRDPAELHFGNSGNFGTTSSITREEIGRRFDWTVLRLREEHDLPPALAHQRALTVLSAELRNDTRLVPRQLDPRTCLVCGSLADSARVLAAILSPHPDERLWLHLEPCHAEYLRAQATRVALLLAASGLREI
jgi:hypothetical protein